MHGFFWNVDVGNDRGSSNKLSIFVMNLSQPWSENINEIFASVFYIIQEKIFIHIKKYIPKNSLVTVN